MENFQRESPDRSLLEGVLHLLSILYNYRRLIILITGITTVGVLALCVLSLRLPPERNPLPNKYRAQSVLLIQQASGSDMASTIMSALGIEQRTIDATSGFDNGALVLLILQSRSIIDQLIAEMDLARHYRMREYQKGAIRSRILKSMSLDYVHPTGAITVSFEDTDPAFARDFVNRLVVLTDTWFSQNRGTAKKKQMKLLEEKVSEVKNDIAGLDNSLKDLQKRYGALTAQDLGTSQATSMADLRSQLILKEIEIKNYSSFSLIDDARLQQLNQERQNILDLIKQIQEGIPGTPQGPSNKMSLPDVAQEFTALTLELDVQRKIYNTLSPQYEAAKLSTESEPLFQVLEMAETPDTKSGPQRSRIIIVAILLAFALSVGLSFFLNIVRQIIRTRGKKGFILRPISAGEKASRDLSQPR